MESSIVYYWFCGTQLTNYQLFGEYFTWESRCLWLGKVEQAGDGVPERMSERL